MLKDFELEERCLRTYQKVRNKWKRDNKNYLIRLKQMKEKKEDNFNIQRNTFLKEYLQKQKKIENHLNKIRLDKNRSLHNEYQLMMKKEKDAKEKQRRKIDNDEKNRLEIQTKVYTKCKIYII